MDCKALALPEELLIVGGAVEAGIFNALREGALPRQKLPDAVRADRRALDAVVDALAALGYLKVNEDQVAITPEAWNVFFNEEHPGYLGFSFMHAYTRLKTWIRLPEILRTGEAPPKERSPERLQYFMEAMRHNARKIAPRVVDLCLEGMHIPLEVLDVGGGPLNYATVFAARGARVTVLDTPEVVAHMQARVPPGAAVRLVAGDFTRELPEGPYDLAFLGNVTHIYGPEENQALLHRLDRVLCPGGRVAILDVVYGLSPRAPFMRVNMLVSSRGGGAWTLEQYTAWLAGAGFSIPRVQHIDFRQLLIAEKV